MKLVFYSLVLNHHQACLADEFYQLLGGQYAFVETAECHDRKGATDDYSKRPYLIKAWESVDSYNRAMELALSAEVCVFGGWEALCFEKARMRRGLLSFDMGERMLKRGWINLLSPRIMRMIITYHLEGWSRKPIYKLCMSAFTARDQYKLCSFRGRCYKWGYFTKVERFDVEASQDVSTSNTTPLMWCSRYLMLKHPELPVLLAKRLKEAGYQFRIDMYGDEGNAARHDAVYPKKKLMALIQELGVEDCVRLMGNRPNNEILQAMREHAIFLFTSDKYEGWGAVANEAMANGCVLVGSDEIGAVPYLVKHGVNGMVFRSGYVDDLYEKVSYLITHREERLRMAQQGNEDMVKFWSPRNAASCLLHLADSLHNNTTLEIREGPCSKA